MPAADFHNAGIWHLYIVSSNIITIVTIAVIVTTIVPQRVRFGVFSWKKGTRRAGWVARGSELGARGPDGLSGPDGWSWGLADIGGTQSLTQRAPWSAGACHGKRSALTQTANLSNQKIQKKCLTF